MREHLRRDDEEPHVPVLRLFVEGAIEQAHARSGMPCGRCLLALAELDWMEDVMAAAKNLQAKDRWVKSAYGRGHPKRRLYDVLDQEKTP